MLSIFEMFTIGIGPSSSHTLGPMKIGKLFLDELINQNILEKTTRIKIDLYGSLASTGKGHLTDTALILALTGETPESIPLDKIPLILAEVEERNILKLNDIHSIQFSKQNDIIFNKLNLPLHENGLTIQAYEGSNVLLKKTYYSTGGGAVTTAENFHKKDNPEHIFPYPFQTATDIAIHCKNTGLSLSSLILKNELSLNSKEKILNRCQHIWDIMKQCMECGMHTEGVLPSPSKLIRRAPILHRTLSRIGKFSNDPMIIIDWVNMFALAVSEENAAGGRVVTAPTNGACGIIPAVFAYYNQFIQPITDVDLIRYFLACGVVGLLFKENASISGAEVGCQGEIGVACSMAAAGLTELLGGSPEHVFMAAEIAMEHNLGLTCDPVSGQVQIPCIERNAINAVKAINASRMAMLRNSLPAVSLDNIIATMFITGKDMNSKYRETSKGGLAVKINC